MLGVCPKVGLVFLPVDADLNQALSATHFGRILEHISDITRFGATLMGLGSGYLGNSVPKRGSEHLLPDVWFEELAELFPG